MGLARIIRMNSYFKIILAPSCSALINGCKLAVFDPAFALNIHPARIKYFTGTRGFSACDVGQRKMPISG
jgi:hypothetical protein